MAIAEQEVRSFDSDLPITVPPFMTEIVAELSQLARQSPHINQRSGVSVRLTVSNVETLVANAVRRSLKLGESEAAPRISDLDALVSSTSGKVEIESLEEGREGEIVEHLLRSAVLAVFKEKVSPELGRQVVDAFEDELVVSAGDDLAVDDYAQVVNDIPALGAAVASLVGDDDSGAVRASAVEFVLEGLHLAKRLNKDSVGGRSAYRSRA